MADVYTADFSARLQLKKNSGVIIRDVIHQPDEKVMTQEAGQAGLSIAAMSSATLGQGSISTVRNFMLITDQPVTVKFNGSANGIVVNADGCLAYFNATITAIVVENNHATNVATVEYGLSD